MRARRAIGWSVLPVAVAMVAAGCGGGGTSPGGSGARTDAAITIYESEPQNPLVPGNTNENGGTKVIDAMFTKLVGYRPDDMAPYNAMAESIATTDSKVYTIKVKKGWKFHDGTDVTAKNFVDAWNYTAYGPNNQLLSTFFEHIQGYADVHPDAPKGQQPPAPKADKLSGLKLVDDYTFEVTLADPFAVFPTTLGYDAFAPLPDAFFKDKAAFEKNPIGNGPFKFVSQQPKVDVKLTRFDGYQGSDKPKIKDVTFKIYQSLDAAYNDVVSGTLDFLETMPSSALAGQKYKADLANRNLERNQLAIQMISFPYYVPAYANPDLHKAISMAIDRDAITKKIFEGARTPVDGWMVPGIKGYKKGQCGEFCTYNPTKAKEYLAKSGFTGPITIASNSDGGHKEWVEAACNSIKNALGVDCQFLPTTSFGEFRKAVNAKQMTGLFRTGWIADYPSIEDFLNPLYRTGASSNDSHYSNPALDAALAAADKSPSEDAAIAGYQQAEAMLAQDMPVIPLWAYVTQAGYSTKVKNVKVTADNKLDLSTVEAS